MRERCRFGFSPLRFEGAGEGIGHGVELQTVVLTSLKGDTSETRGIFGGTLKQKKTHTQAGNPRLMIALVLILCQWLARGKYHGEGWADTVCAVDFLF